MTLSTAPYKGTRDFYPDDMRIQRWMFDRLRSAVRAYGYQEYDGPMLEPLELYSSKTSEEIVNQQLYSLKDRGDRMLAIRPEMTPTLARMVAGKLQELPKPIRWFSIPNLWRYERPQRGRLREHWQLNVDVLGGENLFADVEILKVAVAVMKAFRGEEKIEIRVNHRAITDAIYKKLKAPDSQLQAITRLTDAKDKLGVEKYREALLALQGVTPSLVTELEKVYSAASLDAFPCEASAHLSQVLGLLKDSSARVKYDPALMRGFDYYTGMVFEVYDTSPDNSRAMFGGGRYDNLIGLFGKDKLSGVGFGMGDVTLRNFLETHKLLPAFDSSVDVFVSLPDAKYQEPADQISRELRESGKSVVTPLGVGGFGAHLKQASKLGARFAVLFGESEWAQGQVLVKDLLSGQQASVPLQKIRDAVSTKGNS